MLTACFRSFMELFQDHLFKTIIVFAGRLRLRYVKNGVLSVVLGKYYYSHEFSSGNDVINDTRAYYVNMLTDRMTEGVDTNYVCISRIFLAGFPKSGSTFLADSVTSHTKIFNGMTKEPKWWVPTPRGPNNSPFKATVLYVAKYLLQYVDHSNWYAEQDSEVTLIDSSPNLIAQWSNIGIEETFEDACLLPAVFSTFLSNPHFIIIMRNPVEFLYSAFWCSCSSTIFHNYNLDTAEAKRGSNVFHSMVVRRLNEFQKCHKIFSVERCILNQSFIVDKHPQDFHCGFVSLDFAVYYVHLVKWLRLAQSISGLTPNTAVYTFQVAAVGTNGVTGPFSNPVMHLYLVNAKTVCMVPDLPSTDYIYGTWKTSMELAP